MSNIKIIRNDLELPFKFWVFPGGEIGIKLHTGSVAEISKTGVYAPADSQTIVAHLQNSNDILELMMVTDALRHFDKKAVINLFMPYVPYSRQDKLMCVGESFSLQAFTKLINHLNFNSVTILDPHSEVTPALINNVIVIKQVEILNKFTDFIPTLMGCELISPDSGSNKKTSEIAGWLNKEGFVRADKLRDLSNGNIKETIVYTDDLKGKTVCILDDICEKGGTFIALSKELRKKNCGKIILYITHGIFGGGVSIKETLDSLFANGISEIWTTNSYFKELRNAPDYPKLFVLDIEKFIN